MRVLSDKPGITDVMVHAMDSTRNELVRFKLYCMSCEFLKVEITKMIDMGIIMADESNYYLPVILKIQIMNLIPVLIIGNSSISGNSN